MKIGTSSPRCCAYRTCVSRSSPEAIGRSSKHRFSAICRLARIFEAVAVTDQRDALLPVYRQLEPTLRGNLSDAQKAKIIDALNKETGASGFAATKTWGPTIEDRESQITYSALGQEAPLDAKKTWDPDFAKRQKIKAALDRDLPDFSVRLGGTTSIDVTLPGIDKAYGIQKLRDILGIATKDMLYVGDALFPRRKRCSGA